MNETVTFNAQVTDKVRVADWLERLVTQYTANRASAVTTFSRAGAPLLPGFAPPIRLKT